LLLLESDQLPNRHMDSMAESDLHLQVVVE